MSDVAIVPTGTANLASIAAAFRRLGVTPRLAERTADIESASHVVLPGIGAFGASIGRVRAKSLDGALRARILADRPTICVCVGLQLLFEASAESPGSEGLAIIPGEVGRFEAGVRVPQFGWNEVRALAGSRVLASGFAYFANSYRAL